MLTFRLSAARVRNSIGILALAAFLSSSGTAEARVYPFAYLGGSTIKTVREETDELLNVNEIEDWRQGWSVGAGIRLLALQDGETLTRPPRWEIRLKLEASGGELEDAEFVATRYTNDGIQDYQARTLDTFEYSGWSVGGMALARLVPQVGFFAGPSVQRIKLTGNRDRVWEGTIPDFCNSCGDFQGDAEATVIYGIFEVGARLETTRTPAAVEIFWIPKRIQMSSTQTVDDDGYRAVFAELSSSVGLRLIYDF